MNNHRRRGAQKAGSNRHSATETSMSISNNYIEELDFSEIPRVEENIETSAFFSSNIYRKSTLFDPASS